MDATFELSSEKSSLTPTKELTIPDLHGRSKRLVTYNSADYVSNLVKKASTDRRL